MNCRFEPSRPDFQSVILPPNALDDLLTLTWAMPRYRLPVDAVLLVFAAVGIAASGQRMKLKSRATVAGLRRLWYNSPICCFSGRVAARTRSVQRQRGGQEVA